LFKQYVYVKYGGNIKAQEYPMTTEVEEKFQQEYTSKTKNVLFMVVRIEQFNMYEYKTLLLIT